MSWANPTVARLAIGDLTEDACGGVLICSWPMPSHVLAGYQAFAARLKAELPAEAYIYPASTPHSLSKDPPHSSAHPGVGDRPMSRPACSPVAASSSVGLSPPARAAPILHPRLHCTILTLRAFTGGPLDAAARQQLVAAWTPVLAAARASAEWPSADFKLVMGTPTLEGAAGIFRFEGCDGSPNPTLTLTLP